MTQRSQKSYQKEKAADPRLKDCANCGEVGATLTCAKCKATNYCSKACQKQHWKNGHKIVCVTPEERRPQTMVSAADAIYRGIIKIADAGGNIGECSICLESFSGGALCVLPCKHEFHQDCVEALRKQGVQQVCPLCRTLLPPGPEQLFENATLLYVRTSTRHGVKQVGLESWEPLTTSETEDMTHAVELLTNAANQGHLRSQCNLGQFYYTGSGVAQDLNKAVQWTRKAADQGDADAQYNLGCYYRNGEGISQDHKMAVHWYRKAAHIDNAWAQCILGNMCHEGVGIAQDYNEAVRWYCKAADQGFGQAQLNLGLMYYCGKGTSQDLNKAIFWVSAAEAHDDINKKETEELRKDIEAALYLNSSESSGLEAPSPSKCSCCGRDADNSVKLKPCPRCKGPLYCGKDCQSEHWRKGHKERCKKK